MHWHYCKMGKPHNYEPNTVVWPIGSLVIHDCDAKEAKMLMRVVSDPDENEQVETEYADRDLQRQFKKTLRKGQRQLCTLSYLHDPARFNINIETEKGGA